MSAATIFSLSSAPGRAGVAVFRLSGPSAGHIAQSLSGRPLPHPRFAALRQFTNKSGAAIDEGLLLWMPAPHSFTGEDCAEFQLHGSPAVAEALAYALNSLGARQADAGEFTRRAFTNGKLDLTEAEGLADLIDADTQAQRVQALRQMQGGLKARYEGWREGVLDALAQIEGEIDFPDEADIPDDLAHKAFAPVKSLSDDMAAALDSAERGERATRDIIEVNLVMDGLPVRVSDTAGLRDSDDVIEVEGIRRARLRAEEADIRILVQDLSLPNDEGADLLRDGDFLVLNKSDLKPHSTAMPKITAAISAHSVSAKSGDGLEAFQTKLTDSVQERYSPGRDAGLTRARHKDCVVRAKAALDRAMPALGVAPELAGDDLRAALQALRELAGETDIEAVFDRIFSRFCVGK